MTKTFKAALAAVVAVTFALGVTACTSTPEPVSSTNGEKAITDTPAAAPSATPTPTEAGTPDLDVLPILVEPAGTPAGWQIGEQKGLAFAAPGDWYSFEMSQTITHLSSMSEADNASPTVNVDGIDYSTKSGLLVEYVTDETDWKGNWADADENSYRLNVPGAKYSIARLGIHPNNDTSPGQQPIQSIRARIVAEDGREWTVTLYVATGDYGTSIANQVLASLNIV